MHSELTAIGTQLLCSPIAGACNTLDITPTTGLDHLIYWRLVVRNNDPTGARYDTQKMLELTFYRVDIREDINMVVLQVADYRGLRRVV